jgi:hypothetical protein
MLNRRHADLVPRINAAPMEMKKGGAIEKHYEDGMRDLDGATILSHIY